MFKNKRTQRKSRNNRRKIGRKSRRVKRLRGGTISEIGKIYNIVKDGKPYIKNLMNGYSIEPKVNGSELQNVEKYLNTNSRFVLGQRNLARNGLTTDFWNIKNLNFYNKINDNTLEILVDDVRLFQKINPAAEFKVNYERYYKNMEKIYKFENLYFVKDIYQQESDDRIKFLMENIIPQHLTYKEEGTYPTENKPAPQTPTEKNKPTTANNKSSSVVPVSNPDPDPDSDSAFYKIST